MSTDIKPGQVWAWSNGNRVVVVSVGSLQVAYQYLDPTRPDSSLGVHNYEISGWLRNLSIVAEGAPAPLDPSKVKAGDTVTLTRGKQIVTDEVVRLDSVTPPEGGFSIILKETTYQYLTHTGWTLTDHQPAPEPEPVDEATNLAYWLAEQMGEHVDDQGDETLVETVQRYVSREWKPTTGTNPAPAPEPEPAPGTFVSVLVRGRADRNQGFVTDRGTVMLANEGGDPESVNLAHMRDLRPLVVIDPADVDVDALLRAYAKGYTEGFSVEPRRDGLRAALAQLGIEAP